MVALSVYVVCVCVCVCVVLCVLCVCRVYVCECLRACARVLFRCLAITEERDDGEGGRTGEDAEIQFLSESRCVEFNLKKSLSDSYFRLVTVSVSRYHPSR